MQHLRKLLGATIVTSLLVVVTVLKSEASEIKSEAHSTFYTVCTDQTPSSAVTNTIIYCPIKRHKANLTIENLVTPLHTCRVRTWIATQFKYR